MNTITDNASKLPFFEELTTVEKEMCRSGIRTQFFSKGDFLLGCREQCIGLIYLLYGCVRASMLSEDGREITLFYIHEGESCILSASCVIRQLSFDTQLTVSEDAGILILDNDTFHQLSEENIHVKCFMYELATERFSQVMLVMQDILFHRLDQRIACYLTQESERIDKADIHCTQEEISGNINAARESVTRVLRHMSSNGLIELHRGRVTILDKAGLRRLCDNVTEKRG